jgi:hypothetical protein
MRKTKKTQPVGFDRRPRDGWTNDLDATPMFIREKKVETLGYVHPVMVVPLPFMSPKMRVAVRKFAATIWSGIPN